MRRVRFSTSAIARVQGGRKKAAARSLACKNGRSGPVESFMRPTKRVARLRATNNSCLYPFSSLVLFFFSLFIRLASFSCFRLLLSFIEVIRTRAKRNRGIYRSRMRSASKSRQFRFQIRWSISYRLSYIMTI